MANGTTTLVAIALSCAALVAADPTRKAREGETRTRTFEVVTKTSVVDVLMSVDGEEMPSDRMRGGGATTTTARLVVSDAFEAADGTRATRLRRTFDEVARTVAREGGEERGGPGGPGGRGDRGEAPPLVSRLTGEDVIFEWDAEAAAYAATLPEDSPLDEALLEGLAADLEFADFLPRGAVEPGAKWEVPLEVLASVMRPGGNLHLEREGAEDGGDRRGGFRGRGMRGPDLSELGLEPELEGTLEATLVEFVEVDGMRVARIALAIDVTSKLDATDAIEDVVRETPRGEITVSTLEAVVTDRFEGEGELLWGVEAGCLLSLSIEAELRRVDLSATQTTFDGGEARVMERESTSEGTLTAAFRVSSSR